MTSIQPLAIVTALATVYLAGCGTLTETAHTPSTPENVVSHYADLALANYQDQDALTSAKTLDLAVDALLANPKRRRWPMPNRHGSTRAYPTSKVKYSGSATP